MRGEHLLLARGMLRARDKIHHAAWRVLVLAGGSPGEELGVLRELMGKAHITAIDHDARCVEAARLANFDETVHADLLDWEPAAPFDLIHMDLCAGPSEETRNLFRKWYTYVANRGIFIAAFSYGRDVSEAHAYTLAQWRDAADPNGYGDSEAKRKWWALKRLEDAGVPDHIQGRLCSLFSSGKLHRAISIITYRGNEMPMCSVLFVKNGIEMPCKMTQVSQEDFALLVSHPDVSALYATPQERILAVRRHMAAKLAVHTRESKRTLLLAPPTESPKSGNAA